MNPNKKYGLQMPQKFVPGQMKPKLSIFNEESSDSETEGTTTAAFNKALKKNSLKTYEKKQTKLDIARALKEDPTVYQYDELYDEMDKKRVEVKEKHKEERKPKYIHSLLKQAERRKREQERRTERQVQKEREAEGEQFRDKESFVTSAYREKLEEFKKMEEEERYQDQLEDLTDVSKQKDLSGFYRHLYRQTISGENNKPTMENAEKSSQIEKDISENEVNSESDDNKTKSDNEENFKFTKGKRKYRERKSSSSESEEDHDKTLDSDSSSSSLSSSDSEDEKLTEGNQDEIKDKKEKINDKEIKVKVNNKKDNKENNSEENELKKPKEKINIWKKRCIGESLQIALERYYERKKIILKELEIAGTLQDSPYFNPEKYKYF